MSNPIPNKAPAEVVRAALIRAILAFEPDMGDFQGCDAANLLDCLIDVTGAGED